MSLFEHERYIQVISLKLHNKSNPIIQAVFQRQVPGNQEAVETFGSSELYWVL